MDKLRQILIRESDETNKIYLYKVDKHWFACERSAFYLFSICRGNSILKLLHTHNKNMLLVTVLPNGFQDIGNCHLKVFSQSETQIILECNIICKGFLYWKEGLTLFNDLYFENLFKDFYQSISTL